MEAAQGDPEPAPRPARPAEDGKAFGESQVQKPHQACDEAHEALEAYEVEVQEGKDGRDKERSKKKKNVSKVWSHFYLDPTMLRSGFDVNKKIIGHGGANTKRIFEKTGSWGWTLS